MGRGLWIINFARGLRIVFIIGKYTDFSFCGREVLRVDFCRKSLPLGRCYARGFARITVRNSFLSSYILLAKFYMWRCSRTIIRGLFCTCFGFWEIKSTEGGISGVIQEPTRD